MLSYIVFADILALKISFRRRELVDLDLISPPTALAPRLWVVLPHPVEA